MLLEKVGAGGSESKVGEGLCTGQVSRKGTLATQRAAPAGLRCLSPTTAISLCCKVLSLGGRSQHTAVELIHQKVTH